MKTDTKILLNLNNANQHYDLQREGEQIIVPVIMMTEGVRSGSAGPIFHAAEFYSQNPSDWNGVPVTINHPELDGDLVSVQDVQANLWVVGYIRNAHIEDNKLKGEAVIHVNRAIALSPTLLEHLNAGRPIDVSIGAFTYQDNRSGSYQGEEYQATTVAYTPDHLALLPGGRGACSWNDGCGIRTNEQNDEPMDENFEALKEAIRTSAEGVKNALQSNESGFLEIASAIQKRLDLMDTESTYHFLEEVYDDTFVYRASGRDENKYYKRGYSVNDSGDIEFAEEMTEVRKETNFVSMSDSCGCTSLKRTKFNTNKPKEGSEMDSENTPSGEVMERVVGLINNERTRFTKSDRPWLLQLNEEQLATLEPTEPQAVQVNREDALEALSEDLASIDKVVELVPSDVKEQIEIGIKAYQEERSALIKGIQTNSKEWPEDVLEGMETDNLKRLAKSVTKVDYSLNGGNLQDNADDGSEGEQEVLIPAYSKK